MPGAYNMRVKIVKTRCGPDYTEDIEIPFIHGRGFAEALDVSNTAKDFGILRHSAGQTKVKWNPDDEESWEPLLPDVDKGKAAAFEALEANPWLVEKLRQLCLYAGGSPSAMALEEILAMGPPGETNDNTTSNLED